LRAFAREPAPRPPREPAPRPPREPGPVEARAEARTDARVGAADRERFGICAPPGLRDEAAARVEVRRGVGAPEGAPLRSGVGPCPLPRP